MEQARPDQPPTAGCRLLQQLIDNLEFFALQEGYAPWLIGGSSVAHHAHLSARHH
jgi:hypothetical protein